MLRSDHYFGAVNHPHAFQINPLAYALALADATERAGVFIFENSPALSVDPAGVRKRIATAHGRVRAGRVVLAGNVYLGAVAEQVAGTLVPVTAYTGVTKPLGTRLESVMSYRGAVSDSRYGDYSYRIIDRDRLMWTGGISIRKRNAAWMEKRLARAIRSTYPELGTVAFENFWSGTMGFAVHRMPQIGEAAAGGLAHHRVRRAGDQHLRHRRPAHCARHHRVRMRHGRPSFPTSWCGRAARAGAR